jgi:ammonium transporter, Amt family
MKRLIRILFLLSIAGVLATSHLHAGRPIEATTYDRFLDDTLFNDSFFPVSNLWIVIGAGAVFLMQLGFVTLESGLIRTKNTVSSLYRNVFIACLGIVAYAVCGFTTMFPGEFNGLLSFHGWFGVPVKDYLDLMTPRYDPVTWWAEFIFQAMIAAKVATIVSGAVAERQKLLAYVIFAVLLTAIAYPIAGSWSWGKGWLFRQGFHDFAGAAVVHVFGGFAALACVLLLGARMGKYGEDGKARAIPGHSLPLATIGMFVLWFGWFGFNGASLKSAHPELLGLVVTNTAIGGACGGLASMLITLALFRKPDLTMALNGVLTGLVAITGCADIILPHHAVIAGTVGGLIVVAAVALLDRLKIDDPVGAIPVHAIGGLWGVMAPAVFAQANPWWQGVGALTYAFTGFTFSFLVYGLLKLTIGVRVKPESERVGLDVSEHGQEAYAAETVAS